MGAAKGIVVDTGPATIAAVARLLRLARPDVHRAPLALDGYQEAVILVDDGYDPEAVVVQRGRPVRLIFHQESSAACSGLVAIGNPVSPALAALVSPGETVAVEFLPDTPGEYELSCQMGRRRGRLIVE